jgi:hypothetical protein
MASGRGGAGYARSCHCCTAGRHAAFGAADHLFLVPFCALPVAVDLDDGGVDHGIFLVSHHEEKERKLLTSQEKEFHDICPNYSINIVSSCAGATLNPAAPGCPPPPYTFAKSPQ